MTTDSSSHIEIRVFTGDGDDFARCGDVQATAPATCSIDMGAGNDALYVSGLGTATLGSGDDLVSYDYDVLTSGAASLDVDAGPGRDLAFVVAPWGGGVQYGGPVTIVPGTAPRTLTVSRGTARTETLRNIESAEAVLSHLAKSEVTMSSGIPIALRPKADFVKVDLTIRVPGGVWTKTSTGVTAPGLQPIIFLNGLTKEISIVAV